MADSAGSRRIAGWRAHGRGRGRLSRDIPNRQSVPREVRRCAVDLGEGLRFRRSWPDEGSDAGGRKDRAIVVQAGREQVKPLPRSGQRRGPVVHREAFEP